MYIKSKLILRVDARWYLFVPCKDRGFDVIVQFDPKGDDMPGMRRGHVFHLQLLK